MVIFAFILFWRKSGQTLGMQTWYQLVDEQGQPVGVRQGLTRCAAALLSLLPLGLGYWWSLLDVDGRAGTTACHEAGCNGSRKRSDRQCGHSPQSGPAGRQPEAHPWRSPMNTNGEDRRQTEDQARGTESLGDAKYHTDDNPGEDPCP